MLLIRLLLLNMIIDIIDIIVDINIFCAFFVVIVQAIWTDETELWAAAIVVLAYNKQICQLLIDDADDDAFCVSGGGDGGERLFVRSN